MLAPCWWTAHSGRQCSHGQLWRNTRRQRHGGGRGDDRRWRYSCAGPYGPGTLTVGSLSLGNASLLNYELGTPGVIGSGVNDLTIVNGNLTLDGVLNTTALAGFGPGAYRLFNYGGALTDNTLDIGTVPPGFLASNFTLSRACLTRWICSCWQGRSRRGAVLGRAQYDTQWCALMGALATGIILRPTGPMLPATTIPPGGTAWRFSPAPPAL